MVRHGRLGIGGRSSIGITSLRGGPAPHETNALGLSSNNLRSFGDYTQEGMTLLGRIVRLEIPLPTRF